MTHVLVIQTASAKRVQRSVENLLAGGGYPEPEITVLCQPQSGILEWSSAHPEVQVVTLVAKGKVRIWKELRRKHFDIVRLYWTGERKYRSTKLAAFCLWPCPLDVEIGDGGVFRLTWKAVPRHLLFRWKHPLPTDHWELVPLPEFRVKEGAVYLGERILIIQSAEPPAILRGLEHLSEANLFYNPRYSIFCRNKDVDRFQNHPMLFEVRTHMEAARSWEHLLRLRQEHFDGLVLFFTGDPGYRKIKLFAFFLGVRHKLVFNEHNDCFFFSPAGWIRFLLHRLGEQTPGFETSATPRWLYRFRFSLLLLVKFLAFPFRFAWLLLIWLRLRLGGHEFHEL